MLGAPRSWIWDLGLKHLELEKEKQALSHTPRSGPRALAPPQRHPLVGAQSSCVPTRPGPCIWHAGLQALERSTSWLVRDAGPLAPPSPSSHSAREPPARERTGGSSPPAQARPDVHLRARPRSPPEPARLCAPGSARPGNSARRSWSASTLRELGPKARTGGPQAAKEAGPAGPPGAGARRRRLCQGPVRAGRGAASCPGPAGGGTEGERRGNQTPAGAWRARRRRGSYLWDEGGRGHLRGDGGFSGLGCSWHSWRRGRRGGRAWGGPALRRRPELEARIRPGLAGVGRGGAGSGCVAAQAGRPRGAGGFRRPGLSARSRFFFSLLPEFSDSTAPTYGMFRSIIVILRHSQAPKGPGTVPGALPVFPHPRLLQPVATSGPLCRWENTGRKGEITCFRWRG